MKFLFIKHSEGTEEKVLKCLVLKCSKLYAMEEMSQHAETKGSKYLGKSSIDIGVHPVYWKKERLAFTTLFAHAASQAMVNSLSCLINAL